MPGSPNPDEAAAIAAAIQRFQAETSLPLSEQPDDVAAWQRAALLEGVSAKAGIEDLEVKGGAKWLS